jgi:hypothetical protein
MPDNDNNIKVIARLRNNNLDISSVFRLYKITDIGTHNMNNRTEVIILPEEDTLLVVEKKNIAVVTSSITSTTINKIKSRRLKRFTGKFFLSIYTQPMISKTLLI